MTYTKTEIKNFIQEVCPICNKCTNRDESHIICCPRIFNWKVLKRKDGIVNLSDYNVSE